MGSGPKKADYKPTEAEKLSASVAKADSEFFRQNYSPLNLKRMKDSLTDNTRTTLRGRAAADGMQALTQEPSYSNALNVDAAGNLAGAISGQLNTANISAKEFQNEKQANVLGVARQQQDIASEGLANVARIKTSSLLSQAADKQRVRSAKLGALGEIATAAILRYGEKKKENKKPSSGPYIGDT